MCVQIELYIQAKFIVFVDNKTPSTLLTQKGFTYLLEGAQTAFLLLPPSSFSSLTPVLWNWRLDAPELIKLSCVRCFF